MDNLFLRNAWYAAAWSSDVQENLFSRTILGEPVLFYRDDDRVPIAIGARCPHRFAPLAVGKRFGSTIQCGYHGLRFGRTGDCILNPNGNQKIPSTAHVPSYPLVERYSLLWIWTGDPLLADEAAIPDFSHLTDSDKYTSAKDNYLHIAANYQLMCDNLMDLTHVGYLHSGTLGNAGIARGTLTLEQHADTITAKMFVPSYAAPPAIRTYIKCGDEPVDHWLDQRWTPGCALRLDIGLTRCGMPREAGGGTMATHLLTPETATSTHYFYGSSRTFDLGDAAATEANRQRQRAAFENEDEPMIVAVQRMMGTTDLFELDPVNLSTDAGAIRVRRHLAALIDAENLNREPARVGG